MYSILLIAIGFGLLVFGAHVLVRSASALAVLCRLTPAVIGLTVVAFGTSAPELAVCLTGAVKGSPALSVGNIVGSNIFNISFVLGITALISPLLVPRQALRLDWPVMFLAAALACWFMRDGRIDRLEGSLLLVGWLAFTIYVVRLARRGEVSVDVVVPAGEDAGALGAALLRFLSPWVVHILGVIAGVALLTYGSDRLIEGAAVLARELGATERVIGITILAMGTSLPELATTVVATRKGQDDLALGNLIGSNISNTLLIFGATAAILPIEVAEKIQSWDNPWMLAISVLILPLMIIGRRIGRRGGLVLLAVFAFYIGSVLLR